MDPNKPNFCDTEHCLLKVHCDNCRLLHGGRPWRETLLADFNLPDDNVDFECPYGKTWTVDKADEAPSEAPAQKNAADVTTTPAAEGFTKVRKRGGCKPCHAKRKGRRV